MAKYGFDLTGFGSVKKFKDVLKENNLKSKGRKACKSFKTVVGRRTSCQHQWKNKDLKLVTKVNPITGEADYTKNKEFGYAGYVGIEGESKAVEKLAKSIKKHARYIKGENPKEREFI